LNCMTVLLTGRWVRWPAGRRFGTSGASAALIGPVGSATAGGVKEQARTILTSRSDTIVKMVRALDVPRTGWTHLVSFSADTRHPGRRQPTAGPATPTAPGTDLVQDTSPAGLRPSEPSPGRRCCLPVVPPARRGSALWHGIPREVVNGWRPFTRVAATADLTGPHDLPRAEPATGAADHAGTPRRRQAADAGNPTLGRLSTRPTGPWTVGARRANAARAASHR
jgi:hypothetical protein